MKCLKTKNNRIHKNMQPDQFRVNKCANKLKNELICEEVTNQAGRGDVTVDVSLVEVVTAKDVEILGRAASHGAVVTGNVTCTQRHNLSHCMTVNIYFWY